MRWFPPVYAACTNCKPCTGWKMPLTCSKSSIPMPSTRHNRLPEKFWAVFFRNRYGNSN
nr:MAG TPA: hypothetical protein [Caudoviricetes sp.]